jgi:hypothetical protein
MLKAGGILISMSRKGNPWDNAACESFMKTLNYEEVLRNEYRDLAEAFASIPEFLEKVYNQKRLHSALGYREQPEAPIEDQTIENRGFRSDCRQFGQNHIFSRISQLPSTYQNSKGRRTSAKNLTFWNRSRLVCVSSLDSRGGDMFCSGCGHELEAGRQSCAQCGRPAVPLTPPVLPAPGFEYELARYASKIRVLGVLWLVWAGLSILFGLAALHFMHAFFSGDFGLWGHDHPMFPDWFGPAFIHFALLMVILRAIVCAVAGWGLLERTQWGRIMAIIAAVICMLKIPFGTALGIATLVILLGYRNSTLYDSL